MEYTQIIETARNWDKAHQIEFCDHLSRNITIAIRDIWADEGFKHGLMEVTDMERFVQTYQKPH